MRDSNITNSSVKKPENTIIGPINLTEAELVASISFLIGDLKDVPIDKVTSNLVEYNLGKEFIRRFGLKDTYEFETIVHGLENLEKRGLIVDKEKEVEMDDQLACLLGVVSSGEKMADGTYYDKDTHITSSYHKNENGEYVFTLVSRDTRTTPRSFTKIVKYFGLGVVLIFLVLAGIYFGKFIQKDSSQPNLQLTPTPLGVNDFTHRNYNVNFSFPRSNYLVSMDFEDNKNVNLSYAFLKQNCVNKYANEEEMTSKTAHNGCWGYTADSDIYYVNGPSTRFELKIVDNSDLSKLLSLVLATDKYYADSQTTISHTTVKGVRKVGQNDFVTITRESNYEYFDKETNKTVKGQASKYVQCLYPLNNNNYLYYGTVYASAGSVIDNCQNLEDMGLTGVTVKVIYKDIVKPDSYISSNLGIKFTYLAKPPINQNRIEVKEIGNKIYLFSEGEKPESGQYVEVFRKDKGLNFVSAIKRQVLSGYSDENCVLEIGDGVMSNKYYQEKYQVATLRYSDKLMNADKLTGINQSKCPSPYVSYGGKAFFLYSEKHPESFLFFSIGQYGIEAEDGKMWEETIEFLD